MYCKFEPPLAGYKITLGYFHATYYKEKYDKEKAS